MEETKDFLTLNELCEKLKVSAHSVYKWTHEKKIAYYKIGRNIRFKKSDVENFIEHRRKSTLNELTNRVIEREANSSGKNRRKSVR